jgi:hypothetical protein
VRSDFQAFVGWQGVDLNFGWRIELTGTRPSRVRKVCKKLALYRNNWVNNLELLMNEFVVAQ